MPRHQTLRAAVDWSYDLLDEQERLLFHRLSVFAGGFSLEAAEAVGADRGQGTEVGACGPLAPVPCPPSPEDVLDVLTRLVNKSLVVAETSDDEAARYRLIETLRYYVCERLAASGEAEIIYRRHV